MLDSLHGLAAARPLGACGDLCSFRVQWLYGLLVVQRAGQHARSQVFVEQAGGGPCKGVKDCLPARQWPSRVSRGSRLGHRFGEALAWGWRPVCEGH